MDASGVAFGNQFVYFSNPQIQTYSQNEFANPHGADGAPILNELSVEPYKAPSERRRNIVGFEYDADLSDRRPAVHHHRATKRVVIIANRGTDPTYLLRDLASDAALTVSVPSREPDSARMRSEPK
ncbi:unnamed protein product [Ectocarpus sp. 6 AP-2014]